MEYHYLIKKMFPPGIEPGTFRVLGGCDNHYTTETCGVTWKLKSELGVGQSLVFGINCRKQPVSHALTERLPWLPQLPFIKRHTARDYVKPIRMVVWHILLLCSTAQERGICPDVKGEIHIIHNEELRSLYRSPTLRPRRLSARGSSFLLRKNGADQPRLNSVVQFGRTLPHVENGNKY